MCGRATIAPEPRPNPSRSGCSFVVTTVSTMRLLRPRRQPEGFVPVAEVRPHRLLEQGVTLIRRPVRDSAAQVAGQLPDAVPLTPGDPVGCPFEQLLGNGLRGVPGDGPADAEGVVDEAVPGRPRRPWPSGLTRTGHRLPAYEHHPLHHRDRGRGRQHPEHQGQQELRSRRCPTARSSPARRPVGRSARRCRPWPACRGSPPWPARTTSPSPSPGPQRDVREQLVVTALEEPDREPARRSRRRRAGRASSRGTTPHFDETPIVRAM